MDKINKKDFDFIEQFCKKYNVEEGQGNKNFLAFFLDKYKESNK